MQSKSGTGYEGCSRMRFKRVSKLSWLLLGILMLSATEPVVLAGENWDWSAAQTRLLFDNCFAVVEKDAAQRRIRHCPHHGMDGELSVNQLIFVLGTIQNEPFINPGNREIACKHLENHYQKLHQKLMQVEMTAPLDINRATLAELVSLPMIGPVLAVKVVQHRKSHAGFGKLEDIMKVEGIGPGTFRAIRPYIRVN